MKQRAPTAILLVMAPFAFAQTKGQTFTGEIMDKQCAQMQSHENMMKSVGANNARECTLACVKNGDKFVLFDRDAKKVYVIDDEKKVREYAGPAGSDNWNLRRQHREPSGQDHRTGTLSIILDFGVHFCGKARGCISPTDTL
jgi:hypothetical protein